MQGEPDDLSRRSLDEVGSSSERRRVISAISFHVEMATAQFRFDTPQLVVVERRSRSAGLRGASFNLQFFFAVTKGVVVYVK
jgi:hypothetical protein